ncbi:hypothetical protein FAI40_04860 [Acetobacteraceae bacterium]|nr:hypothetical protein FAI40_04860 [Acetobacteraceae bacterium]
MTRKSLPLRLLTLFSASFMGILTLSTPAKAVDSVYLGLGKTSCKSFGKIANEATTLQTPEAKEAFKPYLIWISGAATGYENACRSLYDNQCSGKNLDVGRLLVAIRDQCNQHPTDLLGDAVTEGWRIIYFIEKTMEKQAAEKEKAKKNPYKKKYQHPKISPPPKAKAAPKKKTASVKKASAKKTAQAETTKTPQKLPNHDKVETIVTRDLPPAPPPK